MTRYDPFDADLFSVFDDDAQAPIPTGGLERLQAAMAGRQPRPARLAGLGGRWVNDPSPAASTLGALRGTVPALRLSAAALLLLLTLVLIGAAALIGGRLLERPSDPERLLYGLDGDIFLADANGGNPVRVAEGAVLLESAPSWAPDGRHFVTFDTTRLTHDIRDPDGHVVAHSQGFGGWSPDSTRLQAWGRGQRQINIYGIDGILQAELPLPDGYTQFRENSGVWAPDGDSIWVLIAVGGSDGRGEREVWALPIDASAPRRVAQGSAVIPFPPSFTPDGTRMAFPDWKDGSATIYVANADGTESREIDAGWRPTWSPNGEQLAYQGGVSDLKVVDVATGIERTLISGWSYGTWPLHSWSRDGDRILFSRQGGPTTGSLWAVGVEGGEPTLLVDGARQGEWQPAPTPAAPTPTPVAPAPTPHLTADVGRLLYGLDGDIFLADADGSNPIRVAEGADLYPGDPWAPDGRHFLSYDTARDTTDIRNVDGDVVASFDMYGNHPVWSPDSTRLQTWATRRGGQINIFGIDGVLQAELPLPDGYARPLQFEGAWAPDGRSVWVQIAPVQGSPCADDSSGYPSECAALEIWELPIDGSAPQRVVEDLDIRVFEPSFSRDGMYLAFSGRDEAMELSVANADGTEARAVVRAGQDSDQGEGTVPIWSPSGEELAYITESGDLKVVDVATGTARTLSTRWPYTNWPPQSWSRDGDRILLSKGSGVTQDGVALGDLWTVGVDGGEPMLLVEGATNGAWQP